MYLFIITIISVHAMSITYVMYPQCTISLQGFQRQVKVHLCLMGLMILWENKDFLAMVELPVARMERNTT